MYTENQVNRNDGNQWHRNGGNGQMAKQGQRSQQKLIQDLRYSHETMFGMLSTLESLGLSLSDSHSQGYGKKMFKHYDRVNYSDKNLRELKSQLQTHIMLTRASFDVFNDEHKDQTWIYPSNFTQSQVEQFVNFHIQMFKGKDSQAQRLAMDILKLLKGQTTNLYIDLINFTPVYSQSERQENNKSLLQKGIFATQQMDKVAEEVKNFTDPNQLQAHINLSNTYCQNPQNSEQNSGKPMEIQPPQPPSNLSSPSQGYCVIIYDINTKLTSKVKIEKGCHINKQLVDEMKQACGWSFMFDAKSQNELTHKIQQLPLNGPAKGYILEFDNYIIKSMIKIKISQGQILRKN